MSTEGDYTTRIKRECPGLFVILLDQSSSMEELIAGGSLTKADFATSALNDIIYMMVRLAGIDDRTGLTKKLAYVSVLGYNDSTHPLLGPTGDPIDITFLSENPRGSEEVERYEFDLASNTYVAKRRTRPFWIGPRADGTTHMAQAMHEAQQVIAQWLASPPETGQRPRQDSFPPVLIHITDAENNGTEDPVAAAMNVRSQGTLQGQCLVITCHVAKQDGQPVVFPADKNEVIGLHPQAEIMFEMSSPIPDPLLVTAREVTRGHNIPSGARAFVYNANAELLVRLLHWGTVGSVGLE